MIDDRVLDETIPALDMPPDAVKKWLRHVRRKCGRHGGERLYADLLAMLDRCEAALERSRGNHAS